MGFKFFLSLTLAILLACGGRAEDEQEDKNPSKEKEKNDGETKYRDRKVFRTLFWNPLSFYITLNQRRGGDAKKSSPKEEGQKRGRRDWIHCTPSSIMARRLVGFERLKVCQRGYKVIKTLVQDLEN